MQIFLSIFWELVRANKWDELNKFIDLLNMVHEAENTDQAIQSLDDKVKAEAKVIAEAQTALNTGPGQS